MQPREEQARAPGPSGCKKIPTNEKRYQDLGSERHQYGISALVTQTSFCEVSSGGLAKRRLFSQATVKENRLECLLEGYDFQKRSFLIKGFKYGFIFFLLARVDLMNLVICYLLNNNLK